MIMAKMKSFGIGHYRRDKYGVLRIKVRAKGFGKKRKQLYNSNLIN